MTTLGTRALYAGPPAALDALGDEVAGYFRHLHETLFGVGIGSLGNLSAYHLAIEDREALTGAGRAPMLVADAETGVLSARGTVALGEVATDADGLLVGADGAVAVGSTAVASGYVEHTLTAGYEAAEHVPLDDTATDDAHVWSAAKIAAEIAAAGGGGGTVTSVGVTGSAALVVGGSPITSSGTITLTLATGLETWATITRASGFDTFAATPSSANLAALVTGETGSGALVFGTAPTISSPTISDRIIKVGAGDIIIPNAAGTFALTDASQALTNKTLTDASVTFVDNGDATKALAFQCSGITTGTTRTLTVPNASGTIALTADLAAYQPLDADLTAIAALATTAFGRGLLTETDASTTRTTLGLVIGTNVQAYDADLASWAGVTRASGFDTFAATPSSANLRSLVSDESGTGALLFANGNIGDATGTSLTLTNTGTDAIVVTDGGTVPAVDTAHVRIQNNSANSDNAILSLIAGNSTGQSYVYFGDSDDEDVGYMAYSHQFNVLAFRVGGSTGSNALQVGIVGRTGIVAVRQGDASDAVRVGGTVYVDQVSTASASATYATLKSYTLPASTLGANGDKLTIRAAIENTTTGANTARWRLVVGTTTVFEITATASNGWDYIELDVYRTGTTSSTGSYRAMRGASASVAVGSGAVTPTTNWSTAQTISVDGWDSGATGELIVHYLDISWAPANT